MDEYPTDKKYESLKIPDRKPVPKDGAEEALPQAGTNPQASLSDGMYYEIEYGSCSIPGVGRFVLKSQEIAPPEKDKNRELFYRMRDIARGERSLFSVGSRPFDQRVRHENSIIFYKQGLFMKDFTDHYTESVPFSSYYPYYQMMGYGQLRTYFTWRTEVRNGNVAATSLSYAFLYIYELLNNIGVDDPQAGLDQLMSFWKAYRIYDKSIDKYVLKWLKDYHIYYNLPQPFKVFIDKNALTPHYDKMTDTDDRFGLFCAISKYDIRKSSFFTDNRANLIADCFCFVIKILRQTFLENGIDFDESIFSPTKKISAWAPFREALFYPWLSQDDRRVVLSGSELYLCSGNKWTFSTVLTSENGRQLIGYVMKQMEVVLRKTANYPGKLTANAAAVKHEAINKLHDSGLSLEKIVSDATAAFYKEATKTVVQVDHDTLIKIRQEALATQEKLIVPEQEALSPVSALPDIKLRPMPEHPPIADAWEGFKNALTVTETEALLAALRGEREVRKFADAHGIMPEVLVDGINGKSADFIGDSLMDEEFLLYDDYRDQIKELVGCLW